MRGTFRAIEFLEHEGQLVVNETILTSVPFLFYTLLGSQNIWANYAFFGFPFPTVKALEI
jgi:hypothetical protein